MMSQAHAEKDDATLTNQTIIGMVRSKVGTGVIINAIKTNPGRYSLDAKSLIQLSGAGVPEAVIEAMQAQGNTAPPPTKESASHSNPQVTSSWVSSTRTNKLDGTKTVEASRVFSVESGGLMRVTAACQNAPEVVAMNAMPAMLGNTMASFAAALTGAKPETVSPIANPNAADPRSLSLSFQYVPNRGSSADFLKVTDPVTYDVHVDGFTNQGTATPHGGGTHVPVSVTVDGTGRTNGSKASFYGKPTTLEFSFYAATMREQMKGAMGGGAAGADKFMSGFVGAFASLYDIGLASMKEAMQSKLIVVDLPLNDGGSAVVEMEPQEASFQDFTSKCMAAFPDPAPAVAPLVAAAAPVVAAAPVYNSQWYEEKGAAFLDQRDYNSAVAMFETAIRMDKNNALAQRRLSLARRLQGSAAANGGPKTVDPGQTVAASGNPSATPPVKNNLSGPPAGSIPGSNPPPSPLVTQAMSTAEVAYANGNYIGAIGAYNRALSLDPNRVSAKAGLAKAQKSQLYWTETNAKLAASGEVADPKNKLMWTLTDNGKNVSWKEANAYCQTLRTGGFTDWRMPQITELANAYSANSKRSTAPLKHAETSFFGGQMAVDPVGSMWDYHINGGILLTGPNVWSGTSPGKDTFSALFFSTGKTTDLPGGFKRTMRALCVRHAELDPELANK